MKKLVCALMVAFSAVASAQAPGGGLRDPRVTQWIAQHQPQLMQEYLQLISTPDVHGDLPNLRRNADLLRTMLQNHGMQAQVWSGPGAPVVFGEHRVAGATRTILFYIHYDGQPVEPKKWAQPDPFTPVLRKGSLESGAETVTDIASLKDFPAEWRVYARASADDRGPILALCAAMSAIQREPTSNIKVYLDGEEEGSGPSLADAIAHHADDLKADLMVLLDGPQHPSRRPTMYYGARGGAGLEITVYTARQGMHSGNYGNWMPDANVRLSQLISTMVQPDGRVAIKGFYDDVPPFDAATKKMFREVPDDSAAMRQQFGIGSVDGAATSLQEGLNLPSFSVHDMHGGELGGVIPGSATARIAMRLVQENDPRTMIDRVIEHIRAQGYFIVEKDPDIATLAAHPRIAKVTSRAGTATAGGAWRTDPASPAGKFVHDAIVSTWGNVVEVRTLGGSVPARPFLESLKLPVIGVALANYDDNQHADNENMRLGNLWDGAETLAGILTH